MLQTNFTMQIQSLCGISFSSSLFQRAFELRSRYYCNLPVNCLEGSLVISCSVWILKLQVFSFVGVCTFVIFVFLMENFTWKKYDFTKDLFSIEKSFQEVILDLLYNWYHLQNVTWNLLRKNSNNRPPLHFNHFCLKVKKHSELKNYSEP